MNKVSSPVIIVLLMALTSFMCLSLSVSYSYVLGAKSGGNTQRIQTGNLDAAIAYNPVSLDLTIMSDEEGLSQEKYSTITIDKNNQYSVFYNIALGYNLGTTGREVSELLPLECIKVALFEIVDGSLSSSPIVGPIVVGDLPVLENNDNILSNTYSLAVGTFQTGVDSSKYALKVWLDNSIDDKYDGRVMYLGVKIKQEPLISKNIYTISGSVTLDGTPVTGATISLQNGLKKSVTSAGAYTLSEVIEGTYNLSVTLSSGITYETTFNISSGTSIGVSEVESSSGSSGSYIQNAAYSSYTTPYKIIKYNNLKTDSNTITNVNYSMPKSYLITGKELIGVQPLNNININLTSQGSISLVEG